MTNGNNFLFILLSLPTYYASVTGAPVKVTEGLLYGQTVTVGEVEISAYLGVPFAKPPLGNLRFSPPQPAEKYEKPFVAKRLTPACYQEKDTTFPGFRGSEMWNADEVTEDCLYLNIWAPKHGRNLHTLVWIFGGGFSSGSPSLDIYNGEILAAQQEVIVVNINYRLGPFGFLYLNNSEVPGNMGLMDQQLALKWIHDNIEAFGGNHSKVTLFGESAGSCSASAHLFAPKSWDFFTNLILQSGTINMAVCHNSPQQALLYSTQLAQLAGCPSDKEHVVECLRAASASELSQISHRKINVGFFEIPFVPITTDINFFQGDFPSRLTKGEFKKVPIMIGTVKDEGSYWLPYFLHQWISKDKKNFLTSQQYLEALWHMFPHVNEVEQKAIAFQYTQRQHCLSDPYGNSTVYRDALNHIFGDYHFTCDITEFANITAKHGPKVYQFLIDQRIGNNPWPEWMGVMHGYEIEYIFGVPLNGKNFSTDDQNMAKKLMRIWYRFATIGQPTTVREEYFPAYNHRGQYVILQANDYLNKEKLKRDDCNFWKLIPLPSEIPPIALGITSSAGPSLVQMKCEGFIFIFIGSILLRL